jgi:hypothetical protein
MLQHYSLSVRSEQHACCLHSGYNAFAQGLARFHPIALTTNRSPKKTAFHAKVPPDVSCRNLVNHGDLFAVQVKSGQLQRNPQIDSVKCQKNVALDPKQFKIMSQAWWPSPDF